MEEEREAQLQKVKKSQWKKEHHHLVMSNPFLMKYRMYLRFMPMISKRDMVRDFQQYLQEIELGKTISSILDEGEFSEQSLTKGRKSALDLYRKKRPRFDIGGVELWSWQAQAFKLIESPSERQVMWITGRKGEGKSMLQRYIETYYGFHRVFCEDLRVKHVQRSQRAQSRFKISIW